jgi:hypothetical protein
MLEYIEYTLNLNVCRESSYGGDDDDNNAVIGYNYGLGMSDSLEYSDDEVCDIIQEVQETLGEALDVDGCVFAMYIMPYTC